MADYETAEPQAEHKPYYCPGCGLQYNYQRECTGKAEAPHPAIDVISTDELNGDPEHHTAAPNTDKLG
jgi:hypothetical protein